MDPDAPLDVADPKATEAIAAGVWSFSITVYLFNIAPPGSATSHPAGG